LVIDKVFYQFTLSYNEYTGEAAGIAMGLVMVGTRSASALGDLLTVSTVGLCIKNIYIVFSILVKHNMKRYNVD